MALPAAATGQETVFGYCISNLNLPTDTKYLTVNHYDNYGFLGANGFPVSGNSYVVKDRQPVAGSYVAESSCTPMGLLTGTINAVLDNSSADKTLWKVNYYDDRARVIQQRSNSHLDNRHKTASTCYDFIGNVTKNTLWHDNGQNRSTEVYNYTYDKWQRPLTTTHSKDGASAVTLASNSYDPIGRLVSTERAGNAAGHNETYAYDRQYNMTSATRDGVTTQYGYRGNR